MYGIIADLIHNFPLDAFKWAASSAPLLSGVSCSDCSCPDLALTYVVGSGPSTIANGQVGTITSAFQSVSPSEDTIWVEFNRLATIDITHVGSWVIHTDNGPVKHVWAYAPSGVGSSDLGSYTFFDYPATTEIPLITSLTCNGLYFRGDPTSFDITIKVTG